MLVNFILNEIDFKKLILVITDFESRAKVIQIYFKLKLILNLKYKIKHMKIYLKLIID